MSDRLTDRHVLPGGFGHDSRRDGRHIPARPSGAARWNEGSVCRSSRHRPRSRCRGSVGRRDHRDRGINGAEPTCGRPSYGGGPSSRFGLRRFRHGSLGRRRGTRLGSRRGCLRGRGRHDRSRRTSGSSGNGVRHGRRRCRCGHRARIWQRLGEGRRSTDNRLITADPGAPTRVRRQNDGRTHGRAGREKQRRVDVAHLLIGMPDTDLHVCTLRLTITGRPDGADRVAFAHGGSSRHPDRPELRERDRPAVRGQKGDGLAVPGNGSREAHDPRHRCFHALPVRTADVDSPMLTSRIRVGRIERVGHEDWAARGPHPGPSGRSEGQPDQREQRGDQQVAHVITFRTRELSCEITTVAKVSDVVKTDDTVGSFFRRSGRGVSP